MRFLLGNQKSSARSELLSNVVEISFQHGVIRQLAPIWCDRRKPPTFLWGLSPTYIGCIGSVSATDFVSNVIDLRLNWSTCTPFRCATRLRYGPIEIASLEAIPRLLYRSFPPTVSLGTGRLQE